MLSIESTGGKEVHDVALMEGNVEGILFSLGVLACRDMHQLWRMIVEVTGGTGSLAAGDTACGFANTAMVLADRGYLPQVLAAVDRAMGSARSLVAYLEGAVGPSKDCAYEGPILKALLGIPISMEGKTAACAHLSHVGNVAAAVCDLWSNESVQNVQLLSGPAPVAFLEMLVYDCRLFNQAIHAGGDAVLSRWLTNSDLAGSPQAFVISPEGAHRIAQAMANAEDDFQRTRAAGLEACRLLREAKERGLLVLEQREWNWLDRIEEALSNCDSEEKAIRLGMESYRDLFLPQEYGL
jgi:methanol--5-hydroxybenzimidazolylcobamide Co-methyltransferase